MPTAKIKLDRRNCRADGSFPIVLSLTHQGKTIRIATRMYASEGEWDAAIGAYIGFTTAVKASNAKIRYLLSQAEMLLLNLEVSGELFRMSAAELRLRMEQELNIVSVPGRGVTLLDYLERAKKGKPEHTQMLFSYTQRKVKEFAGNKRVADVDEKWVTKYRDFFADRYSANTMRQDLTRLGRAFNLAIDDGIISRNPVRLVKKPTARVRKKNLTLEQLRELRDMNISEPGKRRSRDIFMLQFYLMGINIADLYDARGLQGGRLEYIRRKTGIPYSVRVEPEAMEIIERLAGDDGKLVNLPYKSVRAAVSSLDNSLKRIMPALSTNWARHTWATIAAELEIPMETVSHALGHQIGSQVTAVYIAFNQKKVDEANRRVIDHVNADLCGGKK